MKKIILLSLTLLPLLLASKTFDLEADDPAPAAPPQNDTGASVFSDPAKPATEQPAAASQEAAPATEEKPAETAVEEKAAAPEQQAEEEKEPLNYFSLAVKADMTAPLSKVDPGFGAHIDLRYILPWMNPWFTVGVDAAWYRLAGKGTQTDPQIGLYDYSWVIDSVPVNIGAAIEIDKPLKWFVIIAGGGFSLVWARSNGDMFGGNTFAEDIAYGYYVHAGIEFRFLPYGGVTVEYRHSGFFLDFNYPELNEKVGDIGGMMVLVGYKYTY